MEVWKDIEKYEGLYSISSDGNCFSKRSNDFLAKHKYPNGYEFYRFKINGKQHSELVHRLMAIAFIPNTENKPQIDHINGIRDDNRLENLRWVTQSENNLNPNTNEKLKNALRNSEKAKKAREKATDNAAKITRKKVYMYSIDKKLKATYNSTLDAAKENNCFPQNISRCCLGKIKTYKGHIWSYEPL